MENLISVIIPIFNVKPYLVRCLDSILHNTYRNLEIICVDDGSTDGSGAVCDEYARIDSRIKVIHKPNGGLSSARNAGIDIATGEYIGFIDSDDWIHERYFEKLADALKNHDIALSICSYTITQEDNALNNVECTSETRILSVYQTMAHHITKSYAWGKLYRTKTIGSFRFDESLKIEDAPFNADILCSNLQAKVAFIPDALYAYYQRSGSLTSKLDASAVEELCIRYYSRMIEAHCAEEHQIWAMECIKRGLASCDMYEQLEEHSKTMEMRRIMRKATSMLRFREKCILTVMQIPAVYHTYRAIKDR